MSNGCFAINQDFLHNLRNRRRDASTFKSLFNARYKPLHNTIYNTGLFLLYITRSRLTVSWRMSNPGSPIASSPSEEYSEVPTELLSPSERQLVGEYMYRRQHFLSDYERYNPVQNMRTLANHVFDLSENIFSLRRDFDSSRRLLGIVSDSQHHLNESNKGLGHGLEEVSRGVEVVSRGLEVVSSNVVRIESDLNTLRSEVQSIRQETQIGIQETQQGIHEVKQMLTMMMSVRA